MIIFHRQFLQGFSLDFPGDTYSIGSNAIEWRIADVDGE
jgi:hypothetical protein